MYGIERQKKLGATVFEGSTDPTDTERHVQRQVLSEHILEAKRDEFLGLKQGSLSVAEYERKYTELSRYVDVIVAFESDKCRRFEIEEKIVVELSRGSSIASRFSGREQQRFTPGVKIELPVPDRLPYFAEAPISIASKWLELYIESVCVSSRSPLYVCL
ncbi:uncharacterized protein E6C27_scaffold13G001790 [Cucumis melo var. makuwa]|uniref:Retrotransposon gag domain-containing protein n=1 Tax=Cucumis melo var. makuwa TaxID=1194695 RepID=A0A5A7U3Y7_CUCMM|nr:uncharacterized protein E6C27_scaffold13G001790 [Cucumis melo var. makuwa]